MDTMIKLVRGTKTAFFTLKSISIPPFYMEFSLSIYFTKSLKHWPQASLLTKTCGASAQPVLSVLWCSWKRMKIEPSSIQTTYFSKSVNLISEFPNYLVVELFSLPIGLKTCSNYLCDAGDQFSVFTSHVIIQWKKSRVWDTIDDWYINNLAKNQVSAVFHSRVICKSVSSKFIELCKETPCLCPSEGHKHSGRKVTETSVAEFCYWNAKLLL